MTVDSAASDSAIPANRAETVSRARSRTAGERILRPLVLLGRHPWWSAAFLVLLTACLVYTIGGTHTRETDRASWLPENSVPWTLDGMAFMKVAYPGDYAGIQWLNSHVSGAPVIAEAGPSYYDWRSRVGMFTGLPDIINGVHEDEQRYGDEIDPSALCDGTRNPDVCRARVHARPQDVQTLYDSPSIVEAWRIIRLYGVKYIFRGFAETVCTTDHKNCFSRAGLAKFDRMVGHGLTRVFHTKGVSIFEVNGA